MPGFCKLAAFFSAFSIASSCTWRSRTAEALLRYRAGRLALLGVSCKLQACACPPKASGRIPADRCRQRRKRPALRQTFPCLADHAVFHTASYVLSVRRPVTLPDRIPRSGIRLSSDSSSQGTPLPSADASCCQARGVRPSLSLARSKKAAPCLGREPPHPGAMCLPVKAATQGFSVFLSA